MDTVDGGLNKDQKMSEPVGSEEEEGSDKHHIHRPESPTASVSMKSDWSKGEPPNFSNEPGPPHLKSVHHRPESPTPSCVSVKSDWSKQEPPKFSNELGPPDTKVVQHRSGSPVPSCVSMKSDWSMDRPINFKDGHHNTDHRSVHHRPDSPTPSCASMKSDWSKGEAPNFSDEPGPPHLKSVHHRPESPTPSCVSVKSDWSKQEPPKFSNELGPPDTKSVHHRPESPTPSCVSVKSDWSKQEPPKFSNELGPPDTKVVQHRSGSPVPSCVSMKSDWSMDRPINFKDGHHNTDHSVHHRPDSPTPSCASIKSDWSKQEPPTFSNEPERPDTKERKRSCVVTEQTSKCSGERFPTLCGQDVSVQEDVKDYKISLISLDSVTDVTEVPSLSRIYTELYITVGEREGVNNQHEVYQLETVSKMQTLHDTPINCCDIFKPLPDSEKPIRRLTKGIAGIGKTFSARKFTLDWAKGLENQDVILLVPFLFRELNLVIDEKHSLPTLIHVFHPTLEKVTAEQLTVWKVGFIFDGLDESRFSLNFGNNDIISDVTVTTSVDVLLTNLIKGNLLPQALIWITTRPAAANLIPKGIVDMVTEVRGFTDSQKEEYFMKRFGDKELASRIISHMKTSKSIHIMCHIPVFCWITATVLEDMLKTHKTGQLPQTLTAMCCHFVLVQTKRNKLKYDESQQQLMVILKLGRLAFEHLEKGSIMFYKEDLEECDLDVKEASLYSGVCTQIFKREDMLFQRAVYSFVHLSIQEFLAAVYLFHCFTQKNMKVLKTFLGDSCVSSLEDFLFAANNKALDSKNGHLDLFLRFLHGLSLESNQSLLEGLLGQTEKSPESIQRAIKNLKRMNSVRFSPDRCINIFHCLMEMNDHSVHQEIQQFLKTGDKSKTELSLIQCSALAHMLQMSEEVLDEFNPDTYNTSLEGRRRLIPVVRNSRKAWLVGFGRELKQEHIEVVGSALSSNPSHLRHLDLSSNKLDLELLCAGLKSLHCRLETLRLMNCWLSERSCEVLASAISSKPLIHLRELDLNFNILPVSGLKKFSGLESLKVKHGGELWTNPQLLRRYFHPLTLDPNTASRTLCLSDNNRKVTEGEELQSYPDHPDRFEDDCRQVLCTEGLTGRYYWEVEWSGGGDIGVAYREISKRGQGSGLGYNDKSWSLFCLKHSYTVLHNSRPTQLPVSLSVSNRVAVYVDWPAGTVSFYDVSSDTLTHLYTFQSTFTEPLYPGFRLLRDDSIFSSVCLCEDR